MQFLAHRGLWKNNNDKNSRQALRDAFHNGFGVETDIRDQNGELVISHDMPLGENLLFEVMLKDYTQCNCSAVLALNIKSDGLVEHVRTLLEKYNITNYFCFDMSVPDSLSYLERKIIYAARLSEYETEGYYSNLSNALWIDCFHNQSTYSDKLSDWLEHKMWVCFVSPELHGRSPEAFWKKLKELPADLLHNQRLLLCTDYPSLAQKVIL